MWALLFIPAAAYVGYKYAETASVTAKKDVATQDATHPPPSAAATPAAAQAAAQAAANAAATSAVSVPQLQAATSPDLNAQINVGDTILVSGLAIAGVSQLAPELAASQVQMHVDAISSPTDPTGIFIQAHVNDPRLDDTTRALLIGSIPVARTAIIRKV